MLKKTYVLLLCLFILSLTIKAQTDTSQSVSKKINMYWDSSLSMQDKDHNKEMKLLENYFQHVPNIDVILIAFSNSINQQKSFKIVGSDWSELKEVLLNIKYDGMASYDVLLSEQESDINFLFTDGVEIIDKLKINNNTPTFAISSTKSTNTSKLLEQTLPSGGDYINLNIHSIEEALSVLGINTTQNVAQKQRPKVSINTTDGEISGRVYSADGLLVGATITIKGKEGGTVTNKQGVFSIKANHGETVMISYLGKQSKALLIDDPEEVLEVLLIGSENTLDEVVVTGQGNQEPEEVITGFGKVNKEKLGYAVKTIDSKELMSGNATNISDAVRSKMGATDFNSKNDISMTIFRNGAAGVFQKPGEVMGFNRYALVVIDGVPIHNNSTMGGNSNTNKLTDFIDPENIVSVTVLKGLAATNRYGTQGAGGVILIKTKMSLAGKKKKIPYNQALVRGNDFTESLTEVNNSIAHLYYIKALNKHQTLGEVYDAYLLQRNNHLQDPLYFVNVSDFVSQWENKQLATKILSNVLELHPKDVRLLRLAVFKIEQQDKFLAKRIYEKIAKLRPKEAQSYRDLALIYQETGYYQEALDIYLKILNNSYSQVNFSGSKKHIDNELKRLLLLHKNKLNVAGVPPKYLNIKKVACDVRIVFDWNDSMADFELQFVNPQKKFFTWSHTKLDSATRIEKELLQGFNSEEFLLTGVMKGEWLVNIDSQIKDKTPIIIKYTVYKNYAMPNETKETKLLILNSITEKQMLGKIVI